MPGSLSAGQFDYVQSGVAGRLQLSRSQQRAAISPCRLLLLLLLLRPVGEPRALESGVC
jgi:hypothetical protein